MNKRITFLIGYCFMFLILLLNSKKRTKYLKTSQVAGDIAGERHMSWTYILINDAPFIEIHKPIAKRMMWQDPALTQWQGAHSRILLDTLDSRHQWNETPL